MVNRATHELISKLDGKATGVNWDCKSEEIKFKHGNWSGFKYTRAQLDGFGYTLKPVYMPMVNK